MKSRIVSILGLFLCCVTFFVPYLYVPIPGPDINNFRWFGGKTYFDVRSESEYILNASKLSVPQLQLYLAEFSEISNATIGYGHIVDIPDLATTDIRIDYEWYEITLFLKSQEDSYFNQYQKDWRQYVRTDANSPVVWKNIVWHRHVANSMEHWMKERGVNTSVINDLERQSLPVDQDYSRTHSAVWNYLTWKKTSIFNQDSVVAFYICSLIMTIVGIFSWSKLLLIVAGLSGIAVNSWLYFTSFSMIYSLKTILTRNISPQNIPDNILIFVAQNQYILVLSTIGFLIVCLSGSIHPSPTSNETKKDLTSNI
jgi:hypothetical protein